MHCEERVGDGCGGRFRTPPVGKGTETEWSETSVLTPVSDGRVPKDTHKDLRAPDEHLSMVLSEGRTRDLET